MTIDLVVIFYYFCGFLFGFFFFFLGLEGRSGKEEGMGGTYKRFILRIVFLDKSRERLLGAKDRAREVGLDDRLVLDRDAEDGMGVWDAVEGYIVIVFGR